MKQPIRRLASCFLTIIIITLTISSTHSLRGHASEQNQPTNITRSLLDGTEACSNCPSGTHQCIGRSVSDEVCAPCATGNTFWPCNVEKECWCWDKSQPKDPGDEDSISVCNGCSGSTETCIANSNSLIPADDEACAGCATGQKYWPCDVEGLCWCWDSTKPKKPPAPSSGLELTTSGKNACDLFTQEMYDEFAPNNTFPYTYEGFCDAVADYNLYHDEKVFMMGTEEDQRNEIAAFLGNTAHESDDYEAGREYLACADNIEVDGKTYCKPCTNDLFDWENMKCTQSMADLDSPYSEYCQPVFVPPEGCNCETITQVASEGQLAGYVDASKVFYGRGAIQLSWNYNYVKASLALTGSPETFCEDPELVVSDPKYAWGSAIYFWMENEKEGDTCHKEALKHNFGGTLNVINGGLECPAYAGGWHHKAIKMRMNRYCHASILLNIRNIGSMSGCKGMKDTLEECLEDGACPYCEMLNYDESIDLDIEQDTQSDTNAPVKEVEADVDVDSTSEIERYSTTAPSGHNVESSTNSPTVVDVVPVAISSGSQSTVAGTTSEPATSTLISTQSPSIAVPSVFLTISPTSKTSWELESTLISSSSPTTAISGSVSSTSFNSFIETTAPSSIVFNKTMRPSPSLTDLQNTIPTWSPTIIETDPPSYSPTTPAPTLGPCDGDPCPNQFCRSPWGFCGDGDGYCNEDAVWSPDCPIESSAPSPVITGANSQLSTFNLNDFGFNLNSEPDPTNAPTLMNEIPKFTKPSGGKKPPPDKKPILSPTEEAVNKDNVETTNVETSPVPSAQSSQAPTKTPLSESPTPIPILSPDDPAATYFCGDDWVQANQVCEVRCPSAKSEDCPGDQSCYAFTRCNDPPQIPTPTPIYDLETTSNYSPDLSVSDRVTSSHPSFAPAESTSLELHQNNPGCTGKPCEMAGECRSQYGFCGVSFIYCNDLSSWSMENCGLFGTNKVGETLLCDAEVQQCSSGERMIRNPDKNCDFFPCPDEELANSGISGLYVPASGPTLPDLPKPTLPTITSPKKPNMLNSVDFSFGTKPSSQTINLEAARPVMDPSKVIVIGSGEDVADDKAPQATDTNQNDRYSFDSFSYDEWITTVKNSGFVQYDLRVHWSLLLSMTLMTFIN